MSVTIPGSEHSVEHGYGRRIHHMTTAGPGAGLAIWTDQSRSRCVLRLRGRLCSDTVSLLDSHVDLLGCRSCDEVTLDLCDLHLIDRVGARLVVGFGHYVAGRGGKFSIVGAGEPVGVMISAAEVEVAACDPLPPVD